MKRREFLLKSTFAGLALTTMGVSFLKTENGHAAEGEMTLIGAGTTPRILLDPGASEPQQFAAQELAEYLQKITGKTISITNNENDNAPLIVLGQHPLNADLHPEKLGIEESIISVEPNRVRITGGARPPVKDAKGKEYLRDRGTLYGVYHFLNLLGVRWYRPEPWGEHVPQKKTIALPLGKSTFAPIYKYRNSTNLYRWYPDQTPEQAFMARLWAARNFISTGNGDNKFGGGYSVNIAHSYSGLLPPWKYGKTHPEYFALIDGKRDTKGQPCLGNPEVQEIMAQAAVAMAKEKPHVETISLSPNDGTAYCECELCRALDDPNVLSKNGGEKRLGNASMTNRVTYVNNLIAKRVAEAVPGMKVAWYAYLATSEVPTKVLSLEPNIYVAPTSMAAAYGDYSKLLDDPNSGGNRNLKSIIEGWNKITRMVTREYWSGGTWFGPIPMWTVMKDRLTQYRKYRIDGMINESHASWGTQGDLHYILARLMWNPDLDLDAEMREYCQNYYGPAAEPMLRYMQLLEKSSLEGPAWYFLGRFIDRLFVNQKLLDEMTPLIEKARELAKGNDPYERRVHGAWAGYEVVRVRNLVEKYKKEKNPAAAVMAWDQLGKFIQSDTTGELFDAGPVAFKGVWGIMSDQAGIGALRNQIATLRNTPGAAILQNLSEDWKFSTDPKNEGLRKGVIESTFSDRGWAVVNTNSTWQDQGFNYLGTAWYRKTFDLPDKETDKKYALFFGAVDGNAVIYLNGKKAGEHLLGADYSGWDQDFMIDITDALQAGKNILAIQVTKTNAVAGIYKGVTLMKI